MSRKYSLHPINGSYPWIETKIVEGKQWMRLAIPPHFFTEWCVQFEPCAVEWNDIAGRIFMQEILDRARD